jgi:hypothetical protein
VVVVAVVLPVVVVVLLVVVVVPVVVVVVVGAVVSGGRRPVGGADVRCCPWRITTTWAGIRRIGMWTAHAAITVQPSATKLFGVIVNSPGSLQEKRPGLPCESGHPPNVDRHRCGGHVAQERELLMIDPSSEAEAVPEVCDASNGWDTEADQIYRR